MSSSTPSVPRDVASAAPLEMPSKLPSCVIGIDVGGTNTDAVILQDGHHVLAWFKTPTTPDIQAGVEKAIAAVMRKAAIPPGQVESVRIGTTQFVNAILEEDPNKLDKVAVIRLCGPYSKACPPFLDFPPILRSLIEGHCGYVDGGYEVDGTKVSDVHVDQLREQASIIKSKSITSVVIIGIYSPSITTQEEEARSILASELGPEFDISCSYAIGRLGLIERENASIFNACLRRFARHVIAGFSSAVQKLEKCNLYITLNDGTLSEASTAAEYPVRCFSSGPTNSARGAALLADVQTMDKSDDREVLVVDIGGTTTDICALLKSGYPRQSAAFYKFAGVRTNYTIPDVRNIALGGGSRVRVNEFGRTSVGPDSVGSELERESMTFGGQTLTATDLPQPNKLTRTLASSTLISSGLREVRRLLEEAIDLVKTKQGDAKVILVGGGTVILEEPFQLAGVGEIIRPEHFGVANAVGAAIGKISGAIDRVVIPGIRTIEQEIEDATSIAIQRCVEAGGDKATIEIVDVDVVPELYVTNGATRVAVRVVGDLLKGHKDPFKIDQQQFLHGSVFTQSLEGAQKGSKGSTYDIIEQIDLESYRPKLEGNNIWHLSELDLRFLIDGTGVLAVGSCGEPYPSYLACLLALRRGEELKIMRQQTVADDAVILVAGFMGSPSVYLERVPGLNDVADAMQGVISMTGLTTFDAVIPNEIGGFNAFEALLAATRFKKSVLDTDCVARAYPKMWQTVRCLKGVSVTPAAISNGCGKTELFPSARDNIEAEDLMRESCTKLGSLSGMCVNPVTGVEARTLPQNSFSHAWTIGRSIALSRSRKTDIVSDLLKLENGALIFSGKIISVTRNVSGGFTRGSVTLEPATNSNEGESAISSLLVDFENENLSAILQTKGKEDSVLACCPDLITFLDMANGAPVGIADYKYGMRVSVIGLNAPTVWTSDRGLEMGGPKAFGLNMEYQSVGGGVYETPRSVWDMFGESSQVSR